MKVDSSQFSEESPARLGDHLEEVAYADDIAEGGGNIPSDYERHYCDEDGEDWPCSVIRADEEAKRRYPEGPFGLDVSDAIRRSAFISGAAWLAGPLSK